MPLTVTQLVAAIGDDNITPGVRAGDGNAGAAERQAFEVAMKRLGYYFYGSHFGTVGAEEWRYSSAGTQHAWRGWQARATLAAEPEHTGLQDGVRGKIRGYEVWDGRVVLERFHHKHGHTCVEIRFLARSRSCQRRVPHMEDLGHVTPRRRGRMIPLLHSGFIQSSEGEGAL